MQGFPTESREASVRYVTNAITAGLYLRLKYVPDYRELCGRPPEASGSRICIPFH